jgi:2-dehydropantoate 2-reductase
MAGYSIGMKICVFGAGAVGGHIAARLAAKGHDVSVVARGQHLAAIEKNGLKLHHGDEVIQGKVRTTNPGKQDFVIVALKANLLDTFADAAAPLLGPDTAVVFAQNGIRGGTAWGRKRRTSRAWIRTGNSRKRSSRGA